MKEYDKVVLIRDRKRYLEEGVKKDMEGWICDPRIINDLHLVDFHRWGGLPTVATIAVKIKDLRLFSRINRPAKQNDRIHLKDTVDKFKKYGVLPCMEGFIISPEKVNGQWLVEFGKYNSMPELGDVFGNLPGLIQFWVDETDFVIYAPVDEDGNELTEFVDDDEEE